MKDTCRSSAGVQGVFRGHPLAIPLGYPPPPREKVSLRSPLSDGDNASSGTKLPIQEATTENRFPPWALIDKSPNDQQSGLSQGITPGSLACGYHQFSSEYNADTCPAKERPLFSLLISFHLMGVARWPSWCVDAVPCQKHIGAGYCARTNGVQYP